MALNHARLPIPPLGQDTVNLRRSNAEGEAVVSQLEMRPSAFAIVVTPDGFEPSTHGLTYYYSFRCYVVWTVSSPVKVWHVQSLRNPLIIFGKMYSFGLSIFRRVNPKRCRFAKFVRIKVITLIRLRAIYTVDVNGSFINFPVIRPICIPLSRPKPDVYFAIVFASELHLNSAGLPILPND